MSQDYPDGQGYRHLQQLQLPPGVASQPEDIATSKDALLVRNDDIEASGNIVFDIEPDAYGAAILAMTKDLPKVLMREDPDGFHMLQVLFSMGMIGINFVLQIGTVLFIHKLVVLPKIYAVQTQYKAFHAEAFDADGSLNLDLWESFHGKNSVCQVGPGKTLFYVATLFSWVINITKELEACVSLACNIFKVPTCSSMCEMLKQTGDTVSITHLSTPIRVLMYIVIIVPKLAICLYLLTQGMLWLTATTRFEDLVMNAVAMEFVLRLDECLYDAFLPPERKIEVEDIDFCIETEGECNSAERSNPPIWGGYIQSLLYLAVSFLFVLSYARYFQPVLPMDLEDIRKACASLHVLEHDECTSGYLVDAWLLLTGSKGYDCYPFGGQDIEDFDNTWRS